MIGANILYRNLESKYFFLQMFVLLFESRIQEFKPTEMIREIPCH